MPFLIRIPLCFFAIYFPHHLLFYMNTFENLGLEQSILQGISEMGFVSPTPIQEEVIPYMLSNQSDIIGLAQTGTGKTAAFGLPLIQLISTKERTTQGLVLAPTRELCMQIATELRKYSTYKEGIHIKELRLLINWYGFTSQYSIKGLSVRCCPAQDNL